MSLLHVKSDTVGGWTGTVTVFNSQGSTQTVAATDLVRPTDWNSAHNFSQLISGNTSGSSSAVGTEYVLGFTGNVTGSHSTAASAATLWVSVPPQFTGSWWAPELYGNTLTSALSNGTVYLRPFEPDVYLDFDKLIFQESNVSSRSTMSFSGSVSGGAASSGTGSWGHSGTVLLFSRLSTVEANANYASIQTFFSNTWSLSAGYSASVSWSTNASSASVSVTTSGALGWIANIGSDGAITTASSGTSSSTSFSSTSTAAQSFSSSFVMSFPYAHLSGMRPLFVPGTSTDLVPKDYWIGVIQSTVTGSTNMSLQQVAAMSAPGMLFFTATSNNYMEVGNSVAITTGNYRPGFGSYSASSNTTTAIPLNNVSLMASNASMYFAIDGSPL